MALTQSFNGDTIDRVLVITAHPDDVDFGASGTVALLVDAGVRVSYCVVTDGDAGGFDVAVSRDEMRRVRHGEQNAAARSLGVDDVRFLGYPDGRLTVSLDLRRDLSRVIRQARPQRVITQSPVRNMRRIYPSHPDHLATGEAALCAVYPDARNPFAHPDLLAEGLAEHSVTEVWLMGGSEGDTFIDVSASFERKLQALRCHESQVGMRPDLPDFMGGWMRETARAGGLPEGSLAEVFLAVPTI